MITYTIDKSLGHFLLVYTIFLIEITVLIIAHTLIIDSVNFWYIIIIFIISAIISPIGFLKQWTQRKVEQ